jgi:hypothetical protein
MAWSCTTTTRDKFLGFHSKKENDYYKNFYKNVDPLGMDRFRNLITKYNWHCNFENVKKNLTNKNEIRPLKNNLNIRKKMINSVKLNDQVKKSEYHILALLSTAGHHS